MDIVYQLGKPTAAEIHAALPDRPSYSAVRAKLAILEEKGHLVHEEAGPRYVYLPAVPRDRARRSALRHLLDTFFSGSTAQAVTALLDDSAGKLSDEELQQISQQIEEARKRKHD